MIIYPKFTYRKHYSSAKLFNRLRILTSKVVALVLPKVMILYELLKKSETPYAIKAGIVTVLGYLISPVDAIPDFLPGGYDDDVALIAGLIASLDALIPAEVKQRAEARASSFSGKVCS